MPTNDAPQHPRKDTALLPPPLPGHTVPSAPLPLLRDTASPRPPVPLRFLSGQPAAPPAIALSSPPDPPPRGDVRRPRAFYCVTGGREGRRQECRTKRRETEKKKKKAAR